MTVRPLESFDLGPLGPTMTGSFSASASSNDVGGATSGSGAQSSTRSSISYFQSALRVPDVAECSYLFRERYKVATVSRI